MSYLALGEGNTVYCDVDDTLLMWKWPESGVEQWVELDPWNDGSVVKLAVNTAVVEQLKKHAARGHIVIVWSAGGGKWADTAVKALGLEKYVTLSVAKPTWAYDDKESEDFMPKTQWLGRKEWFDK